MAILAAVALAGSGCRPRETPSPAPPQSIPGDPAALKPPPDTLVPLTNMVLIKAGSFVRLDQPVTLAHDFWIDRFEVTQGDYLALTGRNPSFFSGDPRRPVEKVSHADALAYCAALTRRERAAGRLPQTYEYRLPTEAEWEYACRAGSTHHFSFGDDDQEADGFAWTEENSDMSTHPVGLKLPNAWGLHDMHGNVWEWCLDWFADYPRQPTVDPAGPASGEFKVFRGGSWNHQARFARSANRFMMGPSNAIHFVGFRVALAPAPVASP